MEKQPTALVVGASGATGRLLVEQLLRRGWYVRAVVRCSAKLPPDVLGNDRLTVINASLLELSDAEMAELADGCSAVASCLGHNLSLKGLFGPPRRLVTDATRRLCGAILANEPSAPVRYVLMNTAGNSNRDLHEPVSFAQRCVIWLLRRLLPPHADNEQAADYLRTSIGPRHPKLTWAVVRPDTLINQDQPSPYQLHPSPTRSAIFNAGQTSRSNVAQFMAELMTDNATWKEWAGRMPVIYNQA